MQNKLFNQIELLKQIPLNFSKKSKLSKMQSEISKNLIITGCNRGLGLALVNMICENALPYNIIVTARDVIKGQEKFLKLQEKYPKSKLFFHQLDITNKESINNFSKWFSETHKTIDVLVNNAGFGDRKDFYTTKIPSEDLARTTLNTNFYGLVEVTQALLPFLNTNGKIVNVSSALGTLDKHEKNIRQTLLDANLTTEKLLTVGKDYEKQIKNGKLDGWAFSVYTVSKSLVNAYTRFALKKLLKENQMAMAVHPGWCRTDMGGPEAVCSDEDGAKRIYYAMFNVPFVKDEKFNCKFFIEDKVLEEN